MNEVLQLMVDVARHGMRQYRLHTLHQTLHALHHANELGQSRLLFAAVIVSSRLHKPHILLLQLVNLVIVIFIKKQTARSI